ncbi:MAG: hypothetical protein P8Z69_05640, partial [Acidihalobacter sp.]
PKMRSTTARRFAGVGIDLSREAAPDATTLLKFRRLLETQADRLLHGEESDTLGRVREHLEQAKVEHPFQVIKQRFGHRKVRYPGLTKNTAQLYTLSSNTIPFTTPGFPAHRLPIPPGNRCC